MRRTTRSQTNAVSSSTGNASSESSYRDRVHSRNTSTASNNQLSSKSTSDHNAVIAKKWNNTDSTREVEKLLMSFRLYDLQRILTLIQPGPAVGRKVEIQAKILSLLSINFDYVLAKIRIVQNSLIPPQSDCPPEVKRMYQPPMQCTNNIVSNNMIVPQPYVNTMGSHYPIHPDVRLKKLAFYDVEATLLQPSTLVPQPGTRLQEANFHFTLTPSQATEIACNRDIRNSAKIEHSVQVQLRFCMLETTSDQEDCFPPNIILKVNNKMCVLPNPIPTNRPNVEAKRPPRPVNVTSNVKLSPTVTNNISVQWCPDYSRGYVIAAYLVRKLASTDLMHRMKTKGIKAADYTRALIKEKLTEDLDCEIATTMLKVSLICPLGKMRMSIPCRASTCSHLQCFDANLFLQMNERKPTWNCPVCDKPAVYDSLVIDGYFQEVLISPMLSADDTEIQLHKDGSWSTHNLKADTQIVDTPRKPVNKVEVISDDLEVISSEIDKKPMSNMSSNALTVSNEPSSTTNSETVDLTLSDSDDDLPLKRKTAAMQLNANKINANGGADMKTLMHTNRGKPESFANASIISLDSSPSSSPSGYTSDNVTSTAKGISTNESNPRLRHNSMQQNTGGLPALKRTIKEYFGLANVKIQKLNNSILTVNNNSNDKTKVNCSSSDDNQQSKC